MIGIVIVTHGRLAEEFISVLEHVVGPQKGIAAVCMMPDDDLDAKRKEILAKVKDVDAGAGVLLLTDMFGGTPSNLALSIIEDTKVEAIAGINLPLLIKLAKIRHNEPLAQAALAAQEAGRKYISAATALLKGQGG